MPESISSVSSGESTYSCGWITCASTRLRLEPKARRETRFFAVISFSHTDDVASRATRCIDDLHHTASQKAEAKDARFSVILARVLNLSSNSVKYLGCIVKVQSSISQSTVFFPGSQLIRKYYCRYNNDICQRWNIERGKGPNDEVEQREVAPTWTEAVLSQPSTPRPVSPKTLPLVIARTDC